jgi:hypothetical protein
MLNTIDHHIHKARGLQATDLVHPCEGRWVVAQYDATTDAYTALRSTRGRMKTGQVEITGSLAHVATESSWATRAAAMRVAVGTYRSVLVSP